MIFIATSDKDNHNVWRRYWSYSHPYI